MLVQALYNIVDSIFVAKLAEEALTAVTLAFPMQSLIISVASGTGVGVNALLSRSLGERNFKKANDAANSGICLAVFSWLLFIVIGLLLVKPFICLQTSSEIVREYGITYTTLVCCASLGIFFQITFERLLQPPGRTFLSMITQVAGAVTNIILDPLLIFGIGPFPKMGIAGAAIATIFGQLLGSAMAAYFNVRYNKDIQLSLRDMFHPNLQVIKRIYAVGVPSIMMMSIGSIMTFSMNKLLDAFSTTATAVFGVYFKVQSFFFMPVFGLNNGVIPILAYNLGAGRKDRVKDTLKFAVKLAFCIMLLGAICFEVIPGTLLSMFSASDEMKAIGIPALRIIAIHFPIAAVSIILSSVFQAFSRSVNSLIISVCRQLVVLLPAAFIL
ncbi:MAG: MATE family efflux transporter, partial [Lachnospiraceae bacterium]|nr:MATE family efflux transporter [Candidatus Equihabitans merdae]